MRKEKNIHYWLGICNDFLIIPMMTLLILDITEPTPHPHKEALNLFLTASFFWSGFWDCFLLFIRKTTCFQLKRI